MGKITKIALAVGLALGGLAIVAGNIAQAGPFDECTDGVAVPVIVAGERVAGAGVDGTPQVCVEVAGSGARVWVATNTNNTVQVKARACALGGGCFDVIGWTGITIGELKDIGIDGTTLFVNGTPVAAPLYVETQEPTAGNGSQPLCAGPAGCHNTPQWVQIYDATLVGPGGIYEPIPIGGCYGFCP